MHFLTNNLGLKKGNWVKAKKRCLISISAGKNNKDHVSSLFYRKAIYDSFKAPIRLKLKLGPCKMKQVLKAIQSVRHI